MPQPTLDRTQIKYFVPDEFKGIVDKENKILSGVVGSSGVVDRHGESLNPSGWSLNNYTKNPLLLFGHDYRSLPIGKALKVWIEDGKLMFTLKFADTPMGNEVFKLFEEEMLNAFSVGFIPLKWDESGEFTYAEMELLELSVVTVPANPEALAKVKSVEEMMAKEAEKIKEEEAPEPQAKTEDETDVTLKLGELKELIVLAVREAVKEVKEDPAPIEPDNTEQQGDEPSEGNPEDEKPDEPVEQPDEEKGLGDETLSLLKGMRDGLRKSDKELGLALQKLNSLVETK